MTTFACVAVRFLQALLSETPGNRIMNLIEPKQAAIFVSVLAVIAFVINGTQEYLRRGNSVQAFRQQIQHVPAFSAPQPVIQQPMPEPSLTREQQRLDMEMAAARKAEEDAAAKHAQFVARYVNNVPAKQPGVTIVAVVVMSEIGKPNNTLATILARHFSSGSTKAFSSLFTPEFISDGLFDGAAGGSSEAVNKLDLANSLDTLLLAKQSVQYTSNPSLQNVLSAHMRLDVTELSVTARGQNQTWTFSANGAGFSQALAREMAEERIVKQIENDTNMVVSP